MFQVLNDQSTKSPDQKLAIVKVGAITVGLLALCAAVYFFALLPYATR